MAVTNPANWRLRKHEDKSVFGPVHFEKILEWARSAQIAPQDMVSEDGVIWTKAPMVPELEMDWLVQVGDELFYGPTTSQAVLEFLAAGEIRPETKVINCRDNTERQLKECDFFPPSEGDDDYALQPSKGFIRINLQRRIRELETNLMDRQRQLMQAEDMIRKMESRIRELEARLKDLSNFRAKER